MNEREMEREGRLRGVEEGERGGEGKRGEEEREWKGREGGREVEREDRLRGVEEGMRRRGGEGG